MTEAGNHPNEDPIESWKEIATYLKRDVRTAKRWEKSEGLPVHRQMHQARGSVFAYPSELETWKNSRDLRLNAAPVITPWRRATSGFAIAAAMLLALLTMGSGPFRSPSAAAAEPPDGMSAHRLDNPPEDAPLSAVSPDGRYLCFWDWETEDLAIRDLQTGRNHRLTNERASWAGQPAWSPDGKQVAFAWHIGSGAESAIELKVVGLDSGKPRVLSHYDRSGGEGLEVLAWSPDGSQILALVSRGDGPHQMVLVSPTDGSTRVLTDVRREVDTTTARFSPDSRYIAYDFLPDETSPERDIYLMSVDTGKATPLIQHPADDYLLGWSQDGRWLIFASDRTGTLGLYVVAMSGAKTQGVSQLVKPGIGRILPVGLTNEGALYYGVVRATEDVYIANLDPKTGKVTGTPRKAIEQFEGGNFSPEYSPDGKYLAYVSRRGNSPYPTNEGNALCIRSLDTGQERVFYKEIWKLGLHWIDGSRWSPDSRFISLGGSEGIGIAGVYRIDLQTGEITRILRCGPDERLLSGAYGFEGKHFFVRGNSKKGTTEIVVRELKSGKERELYRFPTLERARIALSPDGRWLCFENAGRDGVRSLRIMPALGGKAREIWNFGKTKRGVPGAPQLTWTPDGRYIVFSAPEPSDLRIWDLWRIPVEGGKPEKMGLQKMWGITSLTIRPDGRRIAFANRGGSSSESQLWVLENFLPKAVASK